MNLKSCLLNRPPLLSVASLFFTLAILIAPSTAYATDTVDHCQPIQNVFESTMLNTGMDITRTIGNTVNSFLGDVFQKITGVSLNKMVGCGQQFSEMEGMGDLIPEELAQCDGTPEVICNALLNSFSSLGQNNQNTGGNTEPSTFNNQKYQEMMTRSHVGGSLHGMVLQAATSLEKEAPPVNLAYFVGDSLKNVPFVGKAYASEMESYGNPVLEGIIELWKFTRNVALTVMAVVMLVTGVMIIMRKNISSQVAVTVQYALPKIVIGFFLIVFSYPIGAFIVQLAWVLFFSAPFIVLSQISGNSVTGFAMLVISIMYGILSNPVGFMSIGILMICVIVAYVQMIIFVIKAFLILLKMIFSIVTAPIEFMIGSIPGSEARLTDWFKRMAKYTITLPLMSAITGIALWMGIQFGQDFREATYGFGIFLEGMIPGIMLVYGLSLAIGMEKRVDEFMNGPAKGGKK